jgi:hypothetical protein
VPTVLRYKGYKFYFFSNEGSPREPLHVHVRKGEATAKIWLEPTVAVAESYKMTSGELRELSEVAKKNHKLIERCWNEFFKK